MMHRSPSRVTLAAAAVALLALGAVLLYKSAKPVAVSSFDECAAAGFPIMESFPRQCSDGTRTFTEHVVATEVASASGNVRVTSPMTGSSVSSPLTITGQARAFENTVNWRVLSEDGSVLAEGFATADAADVGQFGSFSAVAQFSARDSSSGAVEVFTISAEDGSEQDLARVPVTFTRSAAQATVQVFFSNTDKDPQSLDCSRVHPTERRVAATSAPARAALTELFRGPTQDEASRGFVTSIPSGVTIQLLEIDDRGVARVDLSGELTAAAGGSCRVAAVRAQIERTLEQFPTVNRVEITVDGRTDALEP